VWRYIGVDVAKIIMRH